MHNRTLPCTSFWNRKWKATSWCMLRIKVMAITALTKLEVQDIRKFRQWNTSYKTKQSNDCSVLHQWPDCLHYPQCNLNAEQLREGFLFFKKDEFWHVYLLSKGDWTAEGRGHQTSFQTKHFWAVSGKQEKIFFTEFIHEGLKLTEKHIKHSPSSLSVNCAFLWFCQGCSAKTRLQKSLRPEKQKSLSCWSQNFLLTSKLFKGLVYKSYH